MFNGNNVQQEQYSMATIKYFTIHTNNYQYLHDENHEHKVLTMALFLASENHQHVCLFFDAKIKRHKKNSELNNQANIITWLCRILYSDWLTSSPLNPYPYCHVCIFLTVDQYPWCCCVNGWKLGNGFNENTFFRMRALQLYVILKTQAWVLYQIKTRGEAEHCISDKARIASKI